MSTSTDPSPADAQGAARDRVGISPARTLADFSAVADLQREIWGAPNTVPVPHLIAVAHAGGTVLVARDGGADRRLVGFCYGFLGVDPDPGAPTGSSQFILWSHMLAVRPEARGRGLGRRLKLAQADAARARGLSRVLWTFDPLEARNAYLNLHVLGATVRRYEVDRYGHMDDPLNAGLDSDRLIADWRIVDPPGAAAPADPEPPIINPGAPAGDVSGPDAAVDAARIAVPSGQWRSPAAHARQWRANARAAFTAAFDAGLEAVDLQPGPEVSHYLLVRP